MQQQGSPGRAHRLPQEQSYRLPAGWAGFCGSGQARDGSAAQEPGPSIRRVQKVKAIPHDSQKVMNHAS